MSQGRPPRGPAATTDRGARCAGAGLHGGIGVRGGGRGAEGRADAWRDTSQALR